MDTFVPMYEFYGAAIDKSIGERKHTNGSLVKELRDIIFTSDVEKLAKFKDMNPETTLYQGHLSECMCGCGQYSTSIDAVTMSQTCNEQLETKPNVLGEKFINKLFEYGYITDKDVYIIFHMLCGMVDYEKWDDVIYLIKKMDPCALKSYYGEKYDSCTHYCGIGDAFYSSHVTHYYGKVHGKAIECFSLLKSFNVLPRDEKSGLEITHSSKTDFWNIEKDISYSKSQEYFDDGTRNVEYWDSLPSSSSDIL